MATVSVPNNTVKVILAGDISRTPAKAVWIQNFSTTVGFSLKAVSGHNDEADAITVGEELYLAPAASATEPTTFLSDTPALATAKWLAKQDSGGTATLNIGRY
jgi:hypothetical protein